jgi:hypothetical protein
MAVYVYCIKEDYRYQSSIKGRTFDCEWFKLEADGTVIVKGSNKAGYAWDGCSIKIKIKDVYFGTPEAVLNFETGYSKTYYATLIHDVFYQYSKDVKSSISRKEVDREFYIILKDNKFKLAKLYYRAVRLLGWLFW